MMPYTPLIADDPDRLVEFYAGLYSNFVTWGPRAASPWLRASLEVEMLGPRHDVPEAFRGRVSMLVDDMAKALAYVKGEGGSVVLAPRRVSSRTLAMIRDPQGNRIGFHTWPE